MSLPGRRLPAGAAGSAGTGNSVVGLGLRHQGAKRMGLAFAGLLLLASPALAVPLTPPTLCPTTATGASITSTGDPAVIGDKAYIVGAPSDGLFFEDDTTSTGDSVSVINNNGVAIDATGTINPGIEITGEFDSICYDGQAGSIASNDSGIAVDELSDGDILLNIAHDIHAGFVGVEVEHDEDGLVDITASTITAGDAGILVERFGAGDTKITANGAIDAVGPGIVVLVDQFGGGPGGDVTIDAKANITSTDSGIAVVHYGDAGDISITTSAGSTISAHGGMGPPYFAPISGTAGIYVDRAVMGPSTGSGDVTVSNGANIDVDGVGIYVDVCGCVESNILINSTGTIDVDTGYGIYVANDTGTTTVTQSAKVTVQDGTGIDVEQDGSGDVAVTAAGIEATDSGISVNHNGDIGTVKVATAAGSTISVTGGIFGGIGIQVTRMAFIAGTGRIAISNGANIEADVMGIYADSCGCVNGRIDIGSSGDITAPFGIFATTADNASLNLTSGVIKATNGVTFIGDTIDATIAAGAKIEVNGSGAGRYGASFMGDSNVTVGGTIDASGTDALLFDGGNARLTLLPGFVITGQVDALDTASNDLIFGGATGNGTFDLDRLGTSFTDFDTFTKTGMSSWTFSGSSFTGVLTANAGTVVINSNIPGLDLMLENTTLHGNAGLKSLTMTGGTLAPGNSIGLITVAGDAAIGAGTIYGVEVNAAGANDKLEAGGTVTIDSTAEVLASMQPGTYGLVTKYTIITGTTAVAGAFGGVASGSAFYDAALTYDPNSVYLTLTRNALTLGDFAKTPNQIATAAALDAGGNGLPYFTELFVLPAGNVPGALDALSGDGYASLTGAALDDSHFVRDAALDRRGARGIWSTPYGGVSHLPGDGNGPAVDHATGGLLLGADGEVGDGYLGVLLGYGQSRYAIPDRDMSASSGEFSLGSYGGADWNQFYASFGATITGRDIDATRQVMFPGVSDTFRAQYASLTAQAFGEIGYRLEMGGTTITPFGGLAGLSTATSGYTETGSGAGALTVDASGASALVATLGLHLGHEIALNDTTMLTLRASAAWKHAIGKPSTSNTMSGTGAFTVAGAPLPADTLAVSAGAALDMGQLNLGLDYSGSFGSGGTSNAATATLAGQF